MILFAPNKNTDNFAAGNRSGSVVQKYFSSKVIHAFDL